LQLNAYLLKEVDRLVAADDLHQAIYVYRTYLNRRNSSYFKLEASGGSAFQFDDSDWNPFHAATGYHRIAVQAMRGLSGIAPVNLILNVPNRGSIAGLADDDVVEIPCAVTKLGPQPATIGQAPHCVRGLIAAVKSYERQTIDAALKRSARLAALALMLNPIVGQWEPARRFVDALIHSDPEHFGGYLEATS
jgi:6-phospho-beta-glucosidase